MKTTRILTGLIALLTTASLHAVDDFNWNNGGPSDWNNAGNWNNINIGSGNNDRFVNNGGIAEIYGNTTLPIRDMIVGRGGGAVGTVNQLAGNHATGGWTYIGQNGGTGFYNIGNTNAGGGGITGFGLGSGSHYTGDFRIADGAGSQGGVNVNTTGSIAANGWFYVGTGGGPTAVGVMNLENGAVGATGNVVVGNDSTGILNMSGGSITAGGELWVGQSGGASGTVTQTGGAVVSNNWLAIGRQGATGVYNLSGTGSLAHTGPNHTIIGSVGGTGTLAQTGGSFSEVNDLRLGEDPTGNGTYDLSAGTGQVNGYVLVGWTNGGNGTLKIGGSGTLTVNQNVEVGGGAGGNGNGTVNLNGGTLLTNFIYWNTGGGAQLNLNGGTFKAMSSQAEIFQNFTTANTELQAGGAVIDSNGNGVATNVALDGVGGLWKTGTGSLTLTAANTYTGNTTVELGNLILTGGVSIASSPLILVKQFGVLIVSGVTGGFKVVSGQTLAGKGIVVGNVTMLPGSMLSPGESAGQLSFNNSLDLSGAVAATASASLVFELDLPGNSDIVVLAPTGGLDIGSGLEFDDFLFSDLGGLGIGVYTLFDTNNAITGTLGTNLSGTIGGYTGTISISNDGQDVLLNVVPEPSAWLNLIGGAAVLMGWQRRRR